MNLLRIAYSIVEDQTYRLFVYGTLMTGEEAHFKLNNAKFLGKRNTAPKYDLIKVDDDFYEMTTGNNCVSGELYELSHDLLLEIDQWEYSVYSRKIIELDDGTKAYAYIT